MVSKWIPCVSSVGPTGSPKLSSPAADPLNQNWSWSPELVFETSPLVFLMRTNVSVEDQTAWETGSKQNLCSNCGEKVRNARVAGA